VPHPAIDACIQLRNKYRLTADQIDRIELRVHPLVLGLTGKKTPQTGLEDKFSIYQRWLCPPTKICSWRFGKRFRSRDSPVSSQYE
jgi:hypothetical protein